jgi:hypothetical protein
MKEAFRSHLIADTGIAALVDKRIAWGARPRASALPSICLHQISGVRQYAMTAPSGLVMARVQVDCWGLTQADVTAVARAVNAAIGGMRQTVAGVQFQGVFMESEQDMTDEGGAAPAELLHRVSQDWMIWHDE